MKIFLNYIYPTKFYKIFQIVACGLPLDIITQKFQAVVLKSHLHSLLNFIMFDVRECLKQ